MLQHLVQIDLKVLYRDTKNKDESQFVALSTFYDKAIDLENAVIKMFCMSGLL
jgi:hypothetical protein